MNGSFSNYAKHAALGALIALIFGAFFGALSGGVISAVYWLAKEAGEFSVKHWDAPGRPLADLWPFHSRRTRDDRLDLLSGWIGAFLGATFVALVGVM
jgi:hypothetical protein